MPKEPGLRIVHHPAEKGGSNGRAKRRETAKTIQKQALIHRQNALPKELPHPPAGKKRAGTFYQVALRLSPEAPVPLKNVMGDLEKKVIIDLLGKVDGNQRVAARILGLKCTTLNEKLKRYHIKVKRFSVIE